MVTNLIVGQGFIDIMKLTGWLNHKKFQIWLGADKKMHISKVVRGERKDNDDTWKLVHSKPVSETLYNILGLVC